jgi:hypothetical protein
MPELFFVIFIADSIALCRRRRDPEEVAQLEAQVQFLLQRVKELENVTASIQLTRSRVPDPSRFTTISSDQALPPGVPSDETRLSSAIDEVGSLMWKLRIGSNGDTSFVGPSSNFHFISAAQEPKAFSQLQNHQETAMHTGRNLATKLDIGYFCMFL